MENPIKINDLGVPLFLETPTYVQNYWSHFSACFDAIAMVPSKACRLINSNGEPLWDHVRLEDETAYWG